MGNTLITQFNGPINEVDYDKKYNCGLGDRMSSGLTLLMKYILIENYRAIDEYINNYKNSCVSINEAKMNLAHIINRRNKIGLTALFIAICNNVKHKIVELLVESGGDLHVTDNDGNNMLYYTVKLGHTDMTKFLLENKVDINNKNNIGKTPFMQAVCNKSYDTEFIQSLIDHKADIHACYTVNDKKNRVIHHNALIWAADNENTPIVKLLVENKVQCYELSLLHYAVSVNSYYLLAFFSQHNVLPKTDEFNGNNKPALICAIEKNINVLKFMVDKYGADGVYKEKHYLHYMCDKIDKSFDDQYYDRATLLINGSYYSFSGEELCAVIDKVQDKKYLPIVELYCSKVFYNRSTIHCKQLLDYVTDHVMRNYPSNHIKNNLLCYFILLNSFN